MTEIEKQHASDLKILQEQMKSFFARKQKIKIYHGSTNSTRAQTFEKGKFVDVTKFNRIIEINTTERYILVEPNVPMDVLIEASLSHHLIPPVVMEFPGITVGGAIQGGAGESSSFKYGLFHNTCLEYEIVLGNGEVIIASPTLNQDLFWGTPCSYGSLGVITLIKLKLIPAKDFVHLTYHKVTNFDEAINLTQKKVNEEVNFVDGIMFSKDSGVIMTGKFEDKGELPISTFRKATDEWFYLHASKISTHFKKYDELIPIRDYLFRYDRGAFWTGRCGFNLLKIPFVKLTRFIMNEFFKTRNVYRFIHATNISQRYLVQDISLPENSALKFLKYVNKKLHIYPLWICPLLPSKYDRLSPAFIETNLVINIGVWGEAYKDYQNFVKLNRDVEDEVAKLSGRKVLYAHAYYTRDEFWRIYDLPWYNLIREKYFANYSFPDIYNKIKVNEKYSQSLLVGIWKFLSTLKLLIF